MNLLKNAVDGTLAVLAVTTWAAGATPTVNLVGRPVPEIDSLPEGPYRELVVRGHELSTRKFAIIGPEVKDPGKRYAGNNLACTSCHEQGGAKPFAIPWVGVTATFPQYRGREDQVSTVEERINGCMERSRNGRSLPLDAPEMKAFTTCIAFLSQGVPVGARIEGAAVRMNRLLTTTRFIRQNMPLGASHTATLLNDDEAYDVTAFMLSKPRPIKADLEADFPARWNKPVDAAFPPYMPRRHDRRIPPCRTATL